MKYFLYILIALSLVSCGTTSIIPLNNQNAEIYIDGSKKGNGVVQIKKTGVMKQIHIEAKLNGVVIGESSAKREFTLGTFIGGLMTYGIGFFIFWHYPETIFIKTLNVEEQQKKSDDMWNAEPTKWK